MGSLRTGNTTPPAPANTGGLSNSKSGGVQVPGSVNPSSLSLPQSVVNAVTGHPVTGYATPNNSWTPPKNSNDPITNERTGNTGVGPTQDPGDPAAELFMRYIKSMMGPLDTNDPQVKAILGGAYSSASADAANRGIQGPAGVASGQQAYINSAAGLQGQRASLGTQLIGAYGNYTTQQKQLALSNAENAYSAQLNQFKADQSRNQSMGSIIGGIGGGLIGGAASIFTAGAAAPLIPGFIAGGAAIGGGIGGSMSGSAPQWNPGAGYGGGLGNGGVSYTPPNSGGRVGSGSPGFGGSS